MATEFPGRAAPVASSPVPVPSSGPVPSAGPSTQVPSVIRRVFNPPKLERKHSSGDLHSRLKTRKILGVGETDNGDVHRSKISQLLGHSEHLYVKFPRGFWVWHLFIAAIFTLQGLLYLLWPERAFCLFLWSLSSVEKSTQFATRLQGSALLGVCTFLWNFQGTTDKAQARSALTAVLLYQCLQFGVCMVSLEGHRLQLDSILRLGTQGLMGLVNLMYHQAIGRSTSGLRKSSSFKDLTTAGTEKTRENCIKEEEKKEM